MLSQLQIASRLQQLLSYWATELLSYNQLPQKSRLINCLTTFAVYIRADPATAAAAPATSLWLPAEIIKNNCDHGSKQEQELPNARTCWRYETGTVSKVPATLSCPMAANVVVAVKLITAHANQKGADSSCCTVLSFLCRFLLSSNRGICTKQKALANLKY